MASVKGNALLVQCYPQEKSQTKFFPTEFECAQEFLIAKNKFTNTTVLVYFYINTLPGGGQGFSSIQTSSKDMSPW